MDSNLICPVDGVPVNEVNVRLIAGFVLLTSLLYGLTGWPLLPILLLVDFSLRSFNQGNYSPFRNGAAWLVKTLHLPYKATDQAPKRFAARIGLGFSVLILSLHLAGVPTWLPVGILSVFAALESLAGFCAGCYVYTLYIWLFPRST